MQFVQPLLEQAQPLLANASQLAQQYGLFEHIAAARVVKDEVIATSVAWLDGKGFFNPQFWMPDGFTWTDIAKFRKQGNLMPQISDLNEIGMFILYFALLRFLLENTVFRLLARIFIKHRPKTMRMKSQPPIFMQILSAHPTVFFSTLLMLSLPLLRLPTPPLSSSAGKRAPHPSLLVAYEKAEKGRLSESELEVLAKAANVSLQRTKDWYSEIKEADLLVVCTTLRVSQ
jgi:hypothetical protein